jgi:hypothetical protein
MITNHNRPLNNLPIRIFMATICITSADCSRPSAATTLAFFTRRPYVSHSRHLSHFSGISRAICHTKMSIQRIAPVFPSVIPADKLQTLHKNCIFCILA